MTKNDGFFIPDEEPKEIHSLNWFERNITHKLDNKHRSLAAANLSNLRNILTADQTKDCIEAYTNNGYVRTITDRQIWFIKGPNTGFVTEPNSELLEGLDEKEANELREELNTKYKELRIDTNRINKRVQLDDRITKYLQHIHVIGCAYQEIIRNKPGLGTGTNKFSRYGEPLALRVLNPLRIEEKYVNTDDYEFEGILYNFGMQTAKSTGDKKKVIKVPDLLAGWYDDAQLFDNTYFSGASPVWTILSASQIVETIMDENLPEFVKAIAEGIGAIYTGTNKESITKQIKDALKHSTFFLHNQKDLDIKELNIARDPQEITGIIKALGQYMCQALGLPLFVMFEDTANFATANQVMQTYKVTTILRHRQWLSNMLERYWYDPIVADWFKCDIEDVIKQEVRLKPVFDDINFETNLDIITGVEKLINLDIYNRVDGAKAINNKEVAARLILEGAAEQDAEKADIKLQQQQLTVEGQEKSNQKIGKPTQQNANRPTNKQPSK